MNKNKSIIFSKFNVIIRKEEDTFIYNTLSGGVLHLNKNYSKKFSQLMSYNSYLDEYNDLIKNLTMGKMIIQENDDEINYLLSQNLINRFSSPCLGLTIAPTMKCNFICPYCYEKNKNYATMNDKVIHNLSKLFKQAQNQYKYLSINWYGGEPLMAIDIIEEITKSAIYLYGENYSAGMVTNGYLLTEDIAKKLDDLKIQHIQITLDGSPEMHNSRRKLPSGKDTFFVIIQNLVKAINISPKTKFTIRVNTDKKNIDSLDRMLDYLKQYDLLGKVGLYLAAVDNINNTCNASECFNNNEFAKKEMDFINRNSTADCNFVRLPSVNFGICGAVSNSSYVIDSLGDIYKCWDDIGNKSLTIGNIDSNIQYINGNFNKWLAYNIQDDQECMHCVFLPICMGGCPNYRLKYKERKCLPIKENVNEMIEVLYNISLKKKAKAIVNERS